MSDRARPDNSVQTCITSPPYFGLRDYGVGGTTGAVALKHGRHYLGIELNQEYIDLAVKRIEEAITPPAPKRQRKDAHPEPEDRQQLDLIEMMAAE